MSIAKHSDTVTFCESCAFTCPIATSDDIAKLLSRNQPYPLRTSHGLLYLLEDIGVHEQAPQFTTKLLLKYFVFSYLYR